MFYSFLHKTTIKSMMTLHNHWKVNLLQGQVFGTACYHKIHYNVDILHLYTNVLMMKTNQVSSFFHDQIGHVYLKFTISDHMVNNRLCNLTPPGSFEHTFVFLFCFLMFEELRHFIIVSTLYPHCFHSTKGQMNNKKQTQEHTFSDIRWSTGDTDMKKLFFF